jgi:hypothetical protein
VDGRGLPIYRRPPCLRHSGSQGQATSTNGHVELFCSTYSLGTLFPRSVSFLALPRKRNSRRSPSQGSPAPGVVPHHLRWCPWGCTLSCCRVLLDLSSRRRPSGARNEVSTDIHHVNGTRLVDEKTHGPGINRILASNHCLHAVPPRSRTIRTSPGSLSWSRESSATPVLAAHGPGNHGGVPGGPVHPISLVPRCWSSSGPCP